MTNFFLLFRASLCQLCSRSKTLALFALLLTFSLIGPANAEIVRLGGTGSALGTMNLLAEEFRKADPEFSMTIVPNLGSGGGLKAVAAGAIDIAVAYRSLKDEEKVQGLVAIEYGRTPFVLATSKKNVEGLSLERIADIYAGRQTEWPDGSPIRLVLRPALDGDTGLLAGFSPAVKQALDTAMSREGMIVAITDQDAADVLERIPGALGPSSLALTLSEKRSITPLAINGVEPSVETLASGAYPYVKTLRLVTKGQPLGTVARFISFVRSAEGREILTKNGHWVVDRQPESQSAFH